MRSFGVRFIGTGWNGVPQLRNMTPVVTAALDRGLQTVGGYLVDQIRRNIVARGLIFGEAFTPNAPMTIRLKGHDKPLINTGGLMSSVGYWRRSGSEFFVGIQDPEYARRAEFLEVGGATTIDGRPVFVPGRPFISPARQKDNVIRTAMSLFQAALRNAVAAGMR